jgi:hypothetical protein
MKVIRLTWTVKNDIGKIYMYKYIRQAVATDGFIPDGTDNPIHFKFYDPEIYRLSISSLRINDFREYAYDIELWQMQKLIKVILDSKTKYKGIE